jgi:hypothetical protein
MTKSRMQKFGHPRLHPLSPETGQGVILKRKRIINKAALPRDSQGIGRSARASRSAHIGPRAKVATYAAAT